MPRTEPVTVPVRGDDRFSRDARNVDRNIRRWGTSARGVNAQMRELNRSVQRMGRSTRQLRSGFAALFTAQTVRRVGQYASSLIDVSSALQEQADALGVASDELEVFQRVLEGDGASVQQVNQGLAFLTRNIGQAAVETTRASREFDRWGVSIRNADGSIRSSLDVYRDLVGALENVDEATRAAALGVTLGEEAARTFAASASRGLQAFDAQLTRERSIGVATEQDNQALKALGDQVRQLQATVSTFGRTMLATFSVQIGELIAQVQNVVSELVKIEQSSSAVSDAVLEVIDNIRRLWQVFKLVTQVAATVFVLGKLRVVFGVLKDVVVRLVLPAFRQVVDVWRRARAAGVTFGNVIRNIGKALTVLRIALGGWTGILLGGSFLGGLFYGVGKLRDRILGIFDPIIRLRDQLDLLPGSTLAAKNAIEELERAFAVAGQVDPDVAARFQQTFDDIQRAYAQIENNRLGPPAPGFTGDYIRGAERRITLAAQTLITTLRAALLDVPDVPLPVPTEEEEFDFAARWRAVFIRAGIGVQRAVREVWDDQLITDPLTALGLRTRPITYLEEGFADKPLQSFQQQINAVTLQPIRDQFNETGAAAALVTERLDDPAFLAAVGDSVNGAADAVERLNGRLSDLVAEGRISQDVADALKQTFGSVEDTTNNLADFLSTLGQSIGDAFADAILQAEKLTDVLKGLLDTIVRAAASAFIGAPLAAFFSNLAGRQHGGPVVPGQSYVVGEQGPELLTVGRNGFVTPRSKLGGAGGLTVNFNGPVQDPQALRAEVQNTDKLLEAKMYALVTRPDVARRISQAAA